MEPQPQFYPCGGEFWRRTLRGFFGNPLVYVISGTVFREIRKPREIREIPPNGDLDGVLVKKRDKVFMRAYDHGDEENILPMFNTVFNSNRTMDHWYWKFRDNPFGRYNIAVATTEDGVLAAHYCGYPVPFHSSVGNQKEFLSFQIGDTMTNPRFRTLGLGTTSVLSQVTKYFYHRFCRDIVPLNYGFNTDNIRKFGERFLGYVYTSHVHYHVMDLNEKKLGALSRVKRFLLGFTFEKVSSCPREYDLFFDRVCNDYGMLVKRTASYLQWRYLDCPDKVHNVFAVRRFRKLVGWSVFSRKDDVLEWGDALFDKKYLYIVGSMLSYLHRQFFPEISQIRGWFSPAPEWWTNALRDAGFEVTREPNNLAPGFRIFDDDFSREFLEHHFYYSMGDSDLF